MKEFKEWLSDYLRYIVLGFAMLLLFLTIYFAVCAVQHYRKNEKKEDAHSIEILTESESLAETESEVATETVVESESEKESESERESETEHASESESETELKQKIETELRRETQRQIQPETEADTEAKTEAKTEAEPETEPVYTPVYKTLIGSCYIRSAPSMDAEILGEYMYGTTVEFLEDVGGWYKVQIDGMIGYMGARFF